ncbi:hypothetical protein E6Q11_03965 [Candidatus Dojkabacteria bacterium]|uniref:Uncharacterized protein n=1 Tax=Candidatus Dojkabacteria bacterium TaxID=2099670 RepID=A0A5C7J5Y7_9BACT|nr:MAG: hypothetical protein E6Q11_03965 [Candidatus Dojkabacteria bacterium]
MAITFDFDSLDDDLEIETGEEEGKVEETPNEEDSKDKKTEEVVDDPEKKDDAPEEVVDDPERKDDVPEEAVDDPEEGLKDDGYSEEFKNLLNPLLEGLPLDEEERPKHIAQTAQSLREAMTLATYVSQIKEEGRGDFLALLGIAVEAGGTIGDAVLALGVQAKNYDELIADAKSDLEETIKRIDESFDLISEGDMTADEAKEIRKYGDMLTKKISDLENEKANSAKNITDRIAEYKTYQDTINKEKAQRDTTIKVLAESSFIPKDSMQSFYKMIEDAYKGDPNALKRIAKGLFPNDKPKPKPTDVKEAVSKKPAPAPKTPQVAGASETDVEVEDEGLDLASVFGRRWS